MKKIKKSFIYFYLIAIGVVTFTTCLYAFSVYPGRLELSVSPGKVHKGYYEVSNTSEKPILVTVEVKDWDMDEEGGVTMYDPPQEFRSLSKWFKIISDELIISGNSSRKIKYEISLPKESKGEYRKYLIFRSSPTGKKEQGFGVATQISMPLYVIVKGTEVFNAEIGEIKINNIAPLEITAVVHNLGNVHIRPVGEIVISKKDGARPILVMPVNTPYPGWPVLPNQKFRFLLYDPIKLDSGDYELKAEFKFGETILLKKLSFRVGLNGEVELMVQR